MCRYHLAANNVKLLQSTEMFTNAIFLIISPPLPSPSSVPSVSITSFAKFDSQTEMPSLQATWHAHMAAILFACGRAPEAVEFIKEIKYT